MITNLRLVNFKCFRNQDLKFRNITLLAGRNGSGKSSVSQALRCFKLLRLNSGKLELKKVNLGVLRDIYYQFNQSTNKVIEIAVDGVSYTSEYNISKSDHDEVIFAKRGNDEELTNGVLGARWLLADRIGPRSIHDDSLAKSENREIGDRGEYAVAFLDRNMDYRIEECMAIYNSKTASSDCSLSNQVSAWLQRIAEGASVRTQSMNDGAHVKLAVDFGQQALSATFRPENVGVGISRVLPILVMVLSSKPGDVLFIENPETDLHPRGQTVVTDLFAKAASLGIQLIVETHSDHIVNGLRLSVKNKVLDKNLLSITFFKRVTDTVTREQFADVRPLEVDGDGELSDYPTDFLDEWGKTIDKLLDIANSSTPDKGNSDDDSER